MVTALSKTSYYQIPLDGLNYELLVMFSHYIVVIFLEFRILKKLELDYFANHCNELYQLINLKNQLTQQLPFEIIKIFQSYHHNHHIHQHINFLY